MQHSKVEKNAFWMIGISIIILLLYYYDYMAWHLSFLHCKIAFFSHWISYVCVWNATDLHMLIVASAVCDMGWIESSELKLYFKVSHKWMRKIKVTERRSTHSIFIIKFNFSTFKYFTNDDRRLPLRLAMYYTI